MKRIAYHLAGRLPASVEVADLIQAGMLGLLEAATNYTADRGASFETYAGIRIRGAKNRVLDNFLTVGVGEKVQAQPVTNDGQENVVR